MDKLKRDRLLCLVLSPFRPLEITLVVLASAIN